MGETDAFSRDFQSPVRLRCFSPPEHQRLSSRLSALLSHTCESHNTMVESPLEPSLHLKAHEVIPAYEVPNGTLEVTAADLPRQRMGPLPGEHPHLGKG
jgi:hypothetical protein